MKKYNKIKFLSFFIILIFIFTLLSPPLVTLASYDLPEGTHINAKGAILVSIGANSEGDTVIFERNADSKYRPAALVHIMASLTAFKLIEEKGSDVETETVTYTEEDFNQIAGTGITTANMKIGEKWHIKDLLNVSLIRTSGDAGVALARHLGGTIENFVIEMNKLAEELGCENTSFNNVIGIDHISQYTTAADMVKILRAASENNYVSDILAKNQYACAPVGSDNKTTFTGTNTLLGKYDQLVFGKAGMTDAEGFNFASFHQKSGYNYICIVLGSASEEENPHFEDTKKLVNWGISGFSYKTILGKNEPVTQMKVDLAWNKDFVTLIPEEPFSATIKNDLDVATIEQKITLEHDGVMDAPIEKDKVYGKIEFFIRVDEKIGEVDLIASESVELSQVMSFWKKTKNILGSFWFKFAAIALAVIIIAYVIVNIIHNSKRKKNRQKKLKKYR